MTAVVDMNSPALESLRELLAGVIEEFQEAVDQEATIGELLAILLLVCHTSTTSVFSDLESVNIAAVEFLAEKGVKPTLIDAKSITALPELQDGVYVAASALLVDGAELLNRLAGQAPTADQFLAALSAVGTRHFPQVFGASPTLSFRRRRSGRVSVRVGDVVALPAEGGKYFFLVVLAIKRFGTAFGFFPGRHPLTAVTMLDRQSAAMEVVYSGPRLIKTGRWRVVDHQPALIEKFPREPEIFHSARMRGLDDRIGPFGSAEAPDGQLRPLSHEEARAIGLLDGSYTSVLLPEQLEQRLREQSGGKV